MIFEIRSIWLTMIPKSRRAALVEARRHLEKLSPPRHDVSGMPTSCARAEASFPATASVSAARSCCSSSSPMLSLGEQPLAGRLELSGHRVEGFGDATRSVPAIDHQRRGRSPAAEALDTFHES